MTTTLPNLNDEEKNDRETNRIEYLRTRTATKVVLYVVMEIPEGEERERKRRSA